jgi:hypothetical protein
MHDHSSHCLATLTLWIGAFVGWATIGYAVGSLLR